jgi:hypothetical protein
MRVRVRVQVYCRLKVLGYRLRTCSDQLCSTILTHSLEGGTVAHILIDLCLDVFSGGALGRGVESAEEDALGRGQDRTHLDNSAYLLVRGKLARTVQ